MRFTLPEKKKEGEFGQWRTLKTVSVPNLPDLIGTVGGEKGLMPFGAKRGCRVILRKLLEHSS